MLLTVKSPDLPEISNEGALIAGNPPLFESKNEILGIAAKEDVKKTQELLAEIRAAGTKKDAKKSKK